MAVKEDVLPSLTPRQTRGGADAPDWPAWDVGDDQVEIAADHFALIEAAAGATADATERWLVAAYTSSRSRERRGRP